MCDLRYVIFVICRKAVSTNNVTNYLDEIVDEKANKPVQKTLYKKLDFRSRRIDDKNSYQDLEFSKFSRSPNPRAIRNLEISSESSSPATLDPSQLPPFEKNFYKLHPYTEEFPDVSSSNFAIHYYMYRNWYFVMCITELMIMASDKTFSGQIWNFTDQTKFDQANLLYIITQ